MSPARAGPIPGNVSNSSAVAVLMLRQLAGVVTGVLLPVSVPVLSPVVPPATVTQASVVIRSKVVGPMPHDHREVLNRTEAAQLTAGR